MRGFIAKFQVSGMQRDNAVGQACSYRAPLTQIPSTDTQPKKIKNRWSRVGIFGEF